MKNICFALFVFFLAGCSSVKLSESWKSTQYKTFVPKKILVVGVTQDQTSRKLFEVHLNEALQKRGLKAEESFVVCEANFTDSKKTEQELKMLEDELIFQDFDAVLISVVKGVDERVSYNREFNDINPQSDKFRGYYFLNQDAFFDTGYYDRFNVYNVEASLYNLDPDSERALVWRASYEIVDPTQIHKTIEAYVKAIVKNLEENELVLKK